MSCITSDIPKARFTLFQWQIISFLHMGNDAKKDAMTYPRTHAESAEMETQQSFCDRIQHFSSRMFLSQAKEELK